MRSNRGFLTCDGAGGRGATDVPQGRARSPAERDNRRCSESGVQPLPPKAAHHLTPGPSSAARPSSFAINHPGKPPVLLQGPLQPLSPIYGLTKQRPVETLTPCCPAQLLPYRTTRLGARHGQCDRVKGLITCRCAFILLLKHEGHVGIVISPVTGLLGDKAVSFTR